MKARDLLKSKTAGLCYETAGRHLMNQGHGGHVVHGSAQLPGQKRLDHAWVDEGRVQGIYEPESGEHISHERFARDYQPQEHHRYDEADTIRNMAQHRHWGPWE